jgi:Raf kinase inhibitor-like YbhB/YbcL family protein
MPFTASTTAFKEGHPLPAQFTCDGTDAPPPIAVADAPHGTASYAVIMEDPDAPSGRFTHWLTYDIPTSDDAMLHVSAGRSLANGFGRLGYGGPCPPREHPAHRYVFTVYAVDVRALTLSGHDRADLETALKLHALALARFTGRYRRG